MPMFYATIFLCTMAQPVCDVEHAFYAWQSDPVFDTEDECYDSAFRQLQAVYWRIADDDDPPAVGAMCERASSGA